MAGLWPLSDERDADVFKFVSFTGNFCNQIFAISKLWNRILNFAWFNGDYLTNIASKLSKYHDLMIANSPSQAGKQIHCFMHYSDTHALHTDTCLSAMMGSTRGGRSRPGKVCSHCACDYSCAFEANLKSTWFTPAAKGLEFFR
jgi:hypothetical protein